MGNDCFTKDLYRYYGKKQSYLDRLNEPLEIKYLRIFRKLSTSNFFLGPISKFYYIYKWRKLRRMTHIQISPSTKIGPGFYIGHLGRVVIHPHVIIGKNCNVATGVTIGKEIRGKRSGVPTLGDNVWIGTNAVIVGNITIGNDVLIAPLSFVNFNVPDHSIVVGNPATIHYSDCATLGYIQNPIK